MQAERGVADGPGDVDHVAGTGAGAHRHRAGGDVAEGGDRQRQRPRRAHGVAADQRAGVSARVGAEAGGEAFEPFRRDARRQGEAQQKAERRRALGGEVGEIDPQRLGGDQLGGIVGEEMHAGDQRVDGDDEVAPRRRRQPRDVVLQRQARRAGERREIAGDEFVLAERHQLK